jgi:AcrR family transcriptional regulator
LERAVEVWRKLPSRQGKTSADTMMGKQQRTRRRLLGHAMELFAKQGYQPTTAAEIAAAAGVSRATFFLHFPTKAALLGELSREIAELWAQESGPADERGTDKLLRFLTFLFRETSIDAVGSAILLDFVATYGGDMRAGSGYETLHDHATRIIIQAQEEGDWTMDWSADALAHHVITTYNLMRAELSGWQPDAAAVRLLYLIANGTMFSTAKFC